MKNIKFNDEELNEIYKLYNDTIDELWALWQTSSLKEIDFQYKTEEDMNRTHWSFTLNDNGINIASYIKQPMLRFSKTNVRIYNLGKPKHNKKKIKKNMSLSEEIVLSFLQDYEIIKTKMIQYLERGTKNKEEFQNILSKIKPSVNKEATIEIDLPETNNQHTIELTEENGKKIGTISFRGVTIKIITDANIEFKNKIEVEKIKRK